MPGPAWGDPVPGAPGAAPVPPPGPAWPPPPAHPSWGPAVVAPTPPPASVDPAGTTRLGAVLTGAAGVVAGLAPLLTWSRLEVALPVQGFAARTNGWGSTTIELETEYSVQSPRGAWGQWTVGTIPDGAVASLIAFGIVMWAVRTVVRAQRGRSGAPGPAASALAPAGVMAFTAAVGVVWVLISWRTQMTALDPLLDEFGPERALAEQYLHIRTGPGVAVTGGAFAVALALAMATAWAEVGADRARSVATLAALPPVPALAGPGVPPSMVATDLSGPVAPRPTAPGGGDARPEVERLEDALRPLPLSLADAAPPARPSPSPPVTATGRPLGPPPPDAL